MEEQLKAMEVGDKIQIGQGNWEDGAQQKFREVQEYASRNLGVQFEVDNRAQKTDKGIEVFHYFLKRIR